MPEDRMTLATPALLSSAIPLLTLAFTDRFLTLAALVRNRDLRNIEEHEPARAGRRRP
jgi:hypothetical protein